MQPSLGSCCAAHLEMVEEVDSTFGDKISWENPLKENGFEFLGLTPSSQSDSFYQIQMTVRWPTTGRPPDSVPAPFVKSGDCHGRFFGRASTEAWPLTSTFITKVVTTAIYEATMVRV